MPPSDIIVCQNKDDYNGPESKVVLSDMITTFDEEESLELRENLMKLEPKCDIEIPMYTFVKDHIWTNKVPESSPKSREILILLYKELDGMITKETKKIRCYGVKDRYLDMVKDLANNKDLELICYDSNSTAKKTSSIAAYSVGWILLSFFDAILSVALRPFFSSTNADLLVKYPVFRPNTFKELESSLNMMSDSTYTLLTVSYFLKVRSVVDSNTNIIPIQCFCSSSDLIKNYLLFARFFAKFVFTDQIEEAVVSSVEKETDVRLEITMSSIMRRAVWSNLSTCIYYGIAYRLFTKEEYKSVLLTSFGPSGKPLAVAAVRNDVNVYILPHGVCAPSTGYDESLYTGAFREGDVVAGQLNANKKKFIPTGLPKLQMIYNKRTEIPDKNEQKTLLIGTTAGTYRDDFICDIVPPVLEQTDWDVVIKVHPSEEKSYYNNLFTDIEITDDQNSRLQIVDKNLHSWIGRSHLLLTTRSNVGIESVLLGTPAASYNPWSPDLWTPPYAKYGDVPCFRDANNFISFLNNMDYNDERERQEAMLNNLYLVRGNSIDQIATQMRKEMM